MEDTGEGALVERPVELVGRPHRAHPASGAVAEREVVVELPHGAPDGVQLGLPVGEVDGHEGPAEPAAQGPREIDVALSALLEEVAVLPVDRGDEVLMAVEDGRELARHAHRGWAGGLRAGAA